jgi:prepilin-type N-terminal cleavage/methylation domain-containing protein
MDACILRSMNKKQYPNCLHRKISGFTLIEVLVSLALLAVLLVGLDAMQITALRKIRETANFSIATEQLVNLSERLHALGRLQGLAAQTDAWNLENAQLLPAGTGVVSGEYPSYIATIYWGKHSGECQEIHTGTSGCIKKEIHLATPSLK